jgi:membrane protease subunit (stomatin/prohibitin family)
MPLFDVLQWNETDEALFAWRHPISNITLGSQLIVAEGQEAVLLREGKFVGPFASGRHTLDVRNIPILQAFINIPFGTSPFPASVWFVRRHTAIELPWGTSSPVNVQDPRFGIAAPIRMRGTATFQISDSCKFLLGLVGTVNKFSRDDMAATMRPAIIQGATTAIANEIQTGSSILDLPSKIQNLASNTVQSANTSIASFGVQITRVWIESINFPEDDEGIMRLRKALADKMQLGVLGADYGTVRSFDVLEKSAANPAGGFMAAGAGIAAGIAGGQVIGNIMTGALGIRCKSCGSSVLASAKFCQACGQPI